jgi:hypothetical protein
MCEEHALETGQSFQQIVLEKLDLERHKIGSSSLSLMSYKNLFKIT